MTGRNFPIFKIEHSVEASSSFVASCVRNFWTESFKKGDGAHLKIRATTDNKISSSSTRFINNKSES